MTLEFPSGEKVVAPLGARELREGIAHRANIGGKRLVPEQIVDIHERDEALDLEVWCEAREQARKRGEISSREARPNPLDAKARLELEAMQIAMDELGVGDPTRARYLDELRVSIDPDDPRPARGEIRGRVADAGAQIEHGPPAELRQEIQQSGPRAKRSLAGVLEGEAHPKTLRRYLHVDGGRPGRALR